jgi:hypothetical protein
MYCGDCGYELINSPRFCSKCGVRVTSDIEGVTVAKEDDVGANVVVKPKLDNGNENDEVNGVEAVDIDHRKELEIVNNLTRAMKPNNGRQSIMGWLSLVAIGLVFTILGGIYNLYIGLGYYFDGTMSVYIDELPSMFYLGIAELVYYGIVVVIAVYAAYLMDCRSKQFPKTTIMLYAISLVLSVILYIWSLDLYHPQIMVVIIEAQGTYLQKMTNNILSLMVWGTYLYVSKRVKYTFVK